MARRVGPVKVRQYSREFKLKAVTLEGRRSASRGRHLTQGGRT